jgi:hypothetical protein
MNMDTIKNQKFTPTKKETLTAERKCAKQCALKTKETTKKAKSQAMEARLNHIFSYYHRVYTSFGVEV